MVFVGGASPPDQLSKMATQIIDISAGRNTGADRTTRIGALRLLAGLLSFKKIYTMHSLAELSDAVLRTTICQIRDRIYPELCALGGVTSEKKG